MQNRILLNTYLWVFCFDWVLRLREQLINKYSLDQSSYFQEPQNNSYLLFHCLHSSLWFEHSHPPIQLYGWGRCLTNLMIFSKIEAKSFLSH